MKIHGELWRGAKDGDYLINFHIEHSTAHLTQTIRACVIVALALCFAFQQTTDGTPAAGQTGPEAADLILHHVFIWPLDESKPQAEAIAARGDRIIKVGGNEEVLALRIGYERCKGAYAFKAIQSKGATLSFGTDWPGTSASIYPISPIYGLYAAVTRQTVRRAPAEGWLPAERLTIEEAIKACAWGSAYASFDEGIKGTLIEGKLADITVLDTNLLRAKPGDWPGDWIDERGEVKVKTLYTVVGGRIVYRS